MHCKCSHLHGKIMTQFFFQSNCVHSHTPTCSWSCICSLQWPETWWTGGSHLHQTHRALERLEKPLHKSWDLKPESLKINRQTDRLYNSFLLLFTFFSLLNWYSVFPATITINHALEYSICKIICHNFVWSLSLMGMWISVAVLLTSLCTMQ